MLGLWLLLIAAGSPGEGATPAPAGSEALSARTATPAEALSARTATPAEVPERPWSQGEVRTFFAATVDVGFLYLRPRASFGYGRPNYLWLGVEANPIITSAGFGLYGGARVALPFVDLRAGVRAFFAFEHSYLAPAETFGRIALSTNRQKASYYTWETELTGAVPLGPGEVVGQVSISAIQGVPEGEFVYEETLHVIAKPPMIWRARLGYNWFLIPGRRHSIGAVGDVVAVPGRATALVRAGLVLRVVLSDTLEVRGTFVPTVFSTDQIGILGGDFTELGLRWRWATGR
jgi:hypothetical protein